MPLQSSTSTTETAADDEYQQRRSTAPVLQAVFTGEGGDAFVAGGGSLNALVELRKQNQVRSPRRSAVNAHGGVVLRRVSSRDVNRGSPLNPAKTSNYSFTGASGVSGSGDAGQTGRADEEGGVSLDQARGNVRVGMDNDDDVGEYVDSGNDSDSDSSDATMTDSSSGGNGDDGDKEGCERIKGKDELSPLPTHVLKHLNSSPALRHGVLSRVSSDSVKDPHSVRRRGTIFFNQVEVRLQPLQIPQPELGHAASITRILPTTRRYVPNVPEVETRLFTNSLRSPLPSLPLALFAPTRPPSFPLVPQEMLDEEDQTEALERELYDLRKRLQKHEQLPAQERAKMFQEQAVELEAQNIQLVEEHEAVHSRLVSTQAALETKEGLLSQVLAEYAAYTKLAQPQNSTSGINGGGAGDEGSNATEEISSPSSPSSSSPQELSSPVSSSSSSVLPSTLQGRQQDSTAAVQTEGGSGSTNSTSLLQKSLTRFADDLFDTLDNNGDGVVKHWEFVEAVEKNRGGVATFLDLPANPTNGTTARVRLEGDSRDAFEEVFHQMDRMDHHAISRDDIRAWAVDVQKAHGVYQHNKSGDGGGECGAGGPVDSDSVARPGEHGKTTTAGAQGHGGDNEDGDTEAGAVQGLVLLLKQLGLAACGGKETKEEKVVVVVGPCQVCAATAATAKAEALAAVEAEATAVAARAKEEARAAQDLVKGVFLKQRREETKRADGERKEEEEKEDTNEYDGTKEEGGNAEAPLVDFRSSLQRIHDSIPSSAQSEQASRGETRRKEPERGEEDEGRQEGQMWTSPVTTRTKSTVYPPSIQKPIWSPPGSLTSPTSKPRKRLLPSSGAAGFAGGNAAPPAPSPRSLHPARHPHLERSRETGRAQNERRKKMLQRTTRQSHHHHHSGRYGDLQRSHPGSSSAWSALPVSSTTGSTVGRLESKQSTVSVGAARVGGRSAEELKRRDAERIKVK